MKIRTHITISKELDRRFRNKFVRRKGDYSNKIEEIMNESLKSGSDNTKIKK